MRKEFELTNCLKCEVKFPDNLSTVLDWYVEDEHVDAHLYEYMSIYDITEFKKALKEMLQYLEENILE